MRCSWAETTEKYQRYHDTEWGVPLFDDQKLFEYICLEAAQAGLNWRMVLERRDAYGELYYNFDIAKVAAMTDEELHEILQNPAIIRNRLKVFAFRKNALAAQAAIERHGSLARYLWRFVDHTPIINEPKTLDDIPATTPESDAMSQQMKKDGFTFVGSTICYAFMQASGMVNDHMRECFRYDEIKRGQNSGEGDVNMSTIGRRKNNYKLKSFDNETRG